MWGTDDYGYKPLSKYSSARDDILHYMCMSDWANDSSGNSEAPTGYYWMISNDAAEVQQSNGEFSSLLEDWLADNPEVTDSPELRAELVGYFIVSTDSQGFVYVAPYESVELLQQAWEALEEVFYDWDEQGED